MTRPLPEDVARTARAYLAALVPADEVSDAWHELVADVTYWGESEPVEVVRLAHQVALQHQPVAPQVAVLALREVGMDQPPTVARVLEVDQDTAQGWTGEVAASVDDAPAATHTPRRDDAATAPTSTDDAAAPVSTDDATDVATARDDGATGPTSTADDASTAGDDASAVRIGFEEDDALRGLDELDSPASTTPRRGLVVAAVALAVLVVLVVWLVGR